MSKRKSFKSKESTDAGSMVSKHSLPHLWGLMDAPHLNLGLMSGYPNPTPGQLYYCRNMLSFPVFLWFQ